MERGHVIELVPARVPAGVVPHAVAAPAMVDDEFIQVIATITDTLFFQNFFDKVHHIASVIGLVITAVNEEDVKSLSIIPEFLF